MARQIINIGILGDENSGDNLRETGIKLNQNFEECYANIATLLTTIQTNAPSASKWQTARIVLLQDEVTGSALIDGTQNITIKTQVAATSTSGANLIVRRDASGGFSAGTVAMTYGAVQGTGVSERYRADAEYAAGTVVVLGGNADVTVADTQADPRVLGVVASQPGVTLNTGRGTDQTCPRIVLLGRTQCRVIGPVTQGDLLVASNVSGYAVAQKNPAAGTVLGKAIQSFTGAKGIIEVVVAPQ